MPLEAIILTETARNWRHKLAETLGGPRYVPLSQAAVQLCEQTASNSGSQLKASLSDQEVTAAYALILLDLDELPVFGRNAKSDAFQEIPRLEIEEMALVDGTLRAASGEGPPLFTDLAIDRTHLRDFLSRIAPIPEE